MFRLGGPGLPLRGSGVHNDATGDEAAHVGAMLRQLRLRQLISFGRNSFRKLKACMDAEFLFSVRYSLEKKLADCICSRA